MPIKMTPKMEIDEDASFGVAVDALPVGATREQLINTTGLTTASHFQVDIFEHLADQIVNYDAGIPTQSLAVTAVAGSGKTTTIVAAAKLIPRHYSAVFLAFNKAIADELGTKLPKHVKSQTLNSLGMGLLFPYLGALGVTNPKVSAFRTHTLARNELTYEERDTLMKDIVWITNMCKSMGVIPVGANDGVGVNGAEATDEVLHQMCMHHGRPVKMSDRATVFGKARALLAKSFSDSNVYDSNSIDFDDQKWMPVCKRPNGNTMAKPRYDVVIIDEVQDVNSVDIEMIKMVLKPNGIVIGVGDDNQAIYGFRGADADAFDTFTTAFNAKMLPLSITYRCGNALVKHAQELVPSIEAAPGAVDGKIETHTNWDTNIFKPQDMVLCRNNAPLIDFAFRLIKDRIPVYVKGRKIGDDLISLVGEVAGVMKWGPNPNRPGSKIKKSSLDGVTVDTVIAKMRGWLTERLNTIQTDDPDNETAKQIVQDRFDSIMVFAANVTTNVANDIVKEIESLFSDDAKKNAVVCATIHKSKGLEAERVFMYRKDCLYPPYVQSGTWQWRQERNLDYVARTRGKSLYAYLSEI